MKPEKQQLIHDLLEDEGRRDDTLLAATKILRRRRHWRAARQTCALIALVGAALWLAGEKSHRQIPPAVAVAPPEIKTPAPVAVQSLTDEQLLALFPNTPVALATLSNGKKILLFPRPGDEARFLTRL